MTAHVKTGNTWRMSKIQPSASSTQQTRGLRTPHSSRAQTAWMVNVAVVEHLPKTCGTLQICFVLLLWSHGNVDLLVHQTILNYCSLGFQLFPPCLKGGSHVLLFACSFADCSSHQPTSQGCSPLNDHTSEVLGDSRNLHRLETSCANNAQRGSLSTGSDHVLTLDFVILYASN